MNLDSAGGSSSRCNIRSLTSDTSLTTIMFGECPGAGMSETTETEHARSLVSGTPFRNRLSLRADPGAAAVEFALVISIFLLVVFGAIQYGYYFMQLQQGSFAAREAARVMSVGTAADCAALVALAESKVAAPAASVTVSTSFAINAAVGDTATLTVAFPPQNFKFGILPFPSGNISQTASVRLENVTAASASYVGCSG